MRFKACFLVLMFFQGLLGMKPENLKRSRADWSFEGEPWTKKPKLDQNVIRQEFATLYNSVIGGLNEAENIEYLEHLLESIEDVKSFRDSEGESWLKVFRNCPQLLESFLRRGFNPDELFDPSQDVPELKGLNLINWAIRTNNIRVFSLALKYGSNPNQQESGSCECAYDCDHKGCSLLARLACDNRRHFMKELLAYGALPNRTNQDCSPLHKLVGSGNMDVHKALGLLLGWGDKTWIRLFDQDALKKGDIIFKPDVLIEDEVSKQYLQFLATMAFAQDNKRVLGLWDDLEPVFMQGLNALDDYSGDILINAFVCEGVRRGAARDFLESFYDIMAGMIKSQEYPGLATRVIGILKAMATLNPFPSRRDCYGERLPDREWFVTTCCESYLKKTEFLCMNPLGNRIFYHIQHETSQRFLR